MWKHVKSATEAYANMTVRTRGPRVPAPTAV